ncbi:hypothetical protein [uncultured Maritimibacter sp.]|jgi:hypothetical protein|uniref:glycosyltransferase family 9 protein n=1 Tax=uncultured Maritimibacter sp. TaxID=991866 RepID=UPI002608FF0C|nr:hypothetical protein [uncultured Maritimibacter sp.]
MSSLDQDIANLRHLQSDASEPGQRAGLAVLQSRKLRRAGLFGPARAVLEAEYRAGSRDPHLLRSLGLERFRAGDIRGGLGLYDEGRWQLDSFEKYRRPFVAPTWAGQPLEGKRILVWGEQGIGDQVMQARLLPDLLARGAEVTVEIDHRLPDLLTVSDQIDAHPQLEVPPPALINATFDFQTSMLSGWRYARNPLAHARILAPDQNLVARYKSVWDKMGPAKNVGLSWQSRAKETGADRSVDPGLLRPIARQEGARFHSLQYGEVDGNQIAGQFGAPVLIDASSDPLTDLTRQIAQLAALDLVITIDNATAHLAGALGVPCWVLLPKASEWRWGMPGQPTPLYPSVRSFRSDDTAHWASALLPLFTAFQDFVMPRPETIMKDPRVASIRFARGLDRPSPSR